MSYAELVSWLAVCPPLGLYYLWHERCRWAFMVKLCVSALAAAFTACLIAGVLSLFTIASPLMAQSEPMPSFQPGIYQLVVDADGAEYHLAGCVHALPDAMPITLGQAARRKVPADERCNPPRYQIRN
jgi:hypothetical protein